MLPPIPTCLQDWLEVPLLQALEEPEEPERCSEQIPQCGVIKLKFLIQLRSEVAHGAGPNYSVKFNCNNGVLPYKSQPYLRWHRATTGVWRSS